MLKDIGKGQSFLLRLVEPKTSGFCKWQVFLYFCIFFKSNILTANIAPTARRSKSNVTTGKQTLRFRTNQTPIIENISDETTKGVDSINRLLENYLGINDSELGKSRCMVW